METVFNVKKLNKGSSFEIDSPVGLAGIRGTDGQLSIQVDPGTGNFSGGVNMLSGSVAVDPSGVSVPVQLGKARLCKRLTEEQIGQTEQAPVPAGSDSGNASNNK